MHFTLTKTAKILHAILMDDKKVSFFTVKIQTPFNSMSTTTIKASYVAVLDVLLALVFNKCVVFKEGDAPGSFFLAGLSIRVIQGILKNEHELGVQFSSGI